MLSTICLIERPSATTFGTACDKAVRMITRWLFACGWTIATAACTISFRPTEEKSSSISPASILEMSRRSLTMSSTWRPERTMSCAYSP